MDPPEKLRITRTGPPSRPPQRGKRASSQPNKKTRGEHRARPVLLLYPRRLSGKHLFASQQAPDSTARQLPAGVVVKVRLAVLTAAISERIAESGDSGGATQEFRPVVLSGPSLPAVAGGERLPRS